MSPEFTPNLENFVKGECKGWNLLRKELFEPKVKEMWDVLDLVKDEDGCIRKVRIRSHEVVVALVCLQKRTGH